MNFPSYPYRYVWLPVFLNLFNNLSGVEVIATCYCNHYFCHHTLIKDIFLETFKYSREIRRAGEMAEHKHAKKNFFSGLGFALLSVAVFTIIFTAIFFMAKGSFSKAYNEANADIPMVKTGLSNPGEVTKYFDRFAWLGGLAFGLIALIAVLALYGIVHITGLTKHFFATGAVISIVYLALLAFGFVLVFLEKAYVPWANGVIFFIGHPLFYASLIMTALSVGSVFLAKIGAK